MSELNEKIKLIADAICIPKNEILQNVTLIEVNEYLQNAAYKGYKLCEKEYEEKLRWIPISEQFPPPCTFVDTMYKYTYAYLFHLENGEFDNCAYNPTHWRLKII